VGISRWLAASLLASIVGPPLIGAVCQCLSWQWVFWLDVPLLIAAFVLVLPIPEPAPMTNVLRGFDSLGLVLLVGGFLLVSFGLQSANELGWNSVPVVAAFVVGGVLLLLFARSERRRPSPLVDLELFRSRHFVASAGIAFAGSVAIGALIFLVPLYLQIGLGITPTASGLILITFEAPAFLIALRGDATARKVGPDLLMLAGMIFFVSGCAVIALVQVTTGVALVVVALVLAGCGRGNVLLGTAVGSMNAVTERIKGEAVGAITLARFFGQAVGVALSLVVFNTLAERRLNGLLPGSTLTHAQVHDIHGLLSGSPAARHSLVHDAPELVGILDNVVRSTSTAGFEAVGVVLVLVSLLGVSMALRNRLIGDAPRRERVPPLKYDGRPAG
jgi:MFS family permease